MRLLLGVAAIVLTGCGGDSSTPLFQVTTSGATTAPSTATTSDKPPATERHRHSPLRMPSD